MDAGRAALVDRLRRRLLSDAGQAGWGYYTGKSSRIEPTCWALLALDATWTAADGAWADFARPHLAFLTGRQDKSGLLGETEPSLANLTANGLASITFTRFESLLAPDAVRALCEGITGLKGVKLRQGDGLQDNRLQGWPWVRDTFSWVEPTAWCLLAMKTARRSQHDVPAPDRVHEAEQLLVNRMCHGGGWNYGNAIAFGQDLRPYVPTTALGLLAMQDQRATAASQQSLRHLSDARLTESSSIALSLTAIALRVYGVSCDDVETELGGAVERSEAAGHVQAMAMALFALSAAQHGAEAFRVAV